eukprot:COSAG06_NODE_30907_length_530_cov_0.844548_1_plen_90_part_01
MAAVPVQRYYPRLLRALGIKVMTSPYLEALPGAYSFLERICPWLSLSGFPLPRDLGFCAERSPLSETTEDGSAVASDVLETAAGGCAGEC